MDKLQESPALYGDAAIREVSRFFMKEGNVYRTLEKITRRLEELHIPYAIVGGMALVAHGYIRATVDVDILVTPEGLKIIHEKLEGLGYVPPFTGSKNLRDVETNTKIEFLVTGGFPGDGKPKPVAFPEPASSAVELEGRKYIRLASLVELKLSSGMTNIGRLKDLADVQELIRAIGLGAEFADSLNPYVREKYRELWRSVSENKDQLE